MKEQQKKQEMSVFNLVLWMAGAFYIGWMIRQILINVSGIEIDYDLYEKNYAWIQLFTYLPFGIVAVKATGARFVKYATAILTLFSLYLINVSADMAVQLDDPWTYIKENRTEVIQYFTNQIIWLLPILIGFVLVELLKIAIPHIVKIEFVKNALDWMKNFWTDKFKRLTSKPEVKVVKEIEKKEVKKVETKKEKVVVKEEKEVKEEVKKDASKKNKRSKKKKRK